MKDPHHICSNNLKTKIQVHQCFSMINLLILDLFAIKISENCVLNSTLHIRLSFLLI